jgi:hypothetical protein
LCLCVDSVWVCSSGRGSEEEEEVEVEVEENRRLQRGLNGRGDCRETRGVRGVYLEVGLECESRDSVRRVRKGESFDAILKTSVYLQKERCSKVKAEQGGEMEKLFG